MDPKIALTELRKAGNGIIKQSTWAAEIMQDKKLRNKAVKDRLKSYKVEVILNEAGKSVIRIEEDSKFLTQTEFGEIQAKLLNLVLFYAQAEYVAEWTAFFGEDKPIHLFFTKLQEAMAQTQEYLNERAKEVAIARGGTVRTKPEVEETVEVGEY